MPPSRDDDVLAASTAATAHLVATSGQASVVDLARAAGISRRTFHRYFPAKEDCLRPLMRDAMDVLVQALDERPRHEGPAAAFVAAFAVAAGGAFADRTRSLVPVVLAAPALHAVWDHEATSSRDRLRPALARRLTTSGATQGEVDAVADGLAEVLTGLALLALRRATERDVDPVTLLDEHCDRLGLHDLPRTTTTPHHDRRRSRDR